VAGAVDALFAVAVGTEPAPAEVDPTPVADDPAPELAARLVEDAARAVFVVALDVAERDGLGLLAVALLVELVATLSIVAPRPGEPADAAPLDDPPPPVLGGVAAVTVGVLVSVVPPATVDDALIPVLVRVCPDATSADCAALEFVELDCGGAGSVTAPLPTWPWPPLPGVGPPTDSVVPGFTVCAAAGSVSASHAMAETATNALMLRQHEPSERVPARWLRHGASATVAGR